MHIAFVTFGNYYRHPTLKRATGMASPLLSRGHKVSILIEDSPENRAKVFVECPGAQIIYHKRGKTARAERAAKQATLNAIQPDVVWICGVGLRNWVCKPTPTSIVLGDHSELVSSFIPKGPRWVYEYISEWLHLWAFDGHICASRYLEDFYNKRLLKCHKHTRVHYSPYAFEPHFVHSSKPVLNRIRERCRYSKTIVYMGGMWENYGCWDMLEVFRKLLMNRRDFQVFMIGKGPELERARAWVSDNGLEGHCYLEGYVQEDHLSSYFDLADVFLCPLRDTVQDKARCPSKLYMYLPFRKPIITSAIGEAAELFGKDGLYYTPGDRDALETLIADFLDGKLSGKALPDPEAHTYEARTVAFLNWFASNWAESKRITE